MRAAACVTAVIFWLATAASADVVHRRAGMPSVEAKIAKFDDSGLWIERAVGQQEFIRWDHISDFAIDRSEPGIDRYREIATNLWRARTRLERQDAAMAEPIFERLFERYRGQTNETALLVAEGLLRCRLMRGGNDTAVIPALEAIRIRRALNYTAQLFAGLSSIFDDQISLCVELPPVWLMSPSLTQADRDLASYNAGTDTTVAAMAALYLRAIRHQIGARQDEHQRQLAADHPGVIFLSAIIDLQDQDRQKRASAYEMLNRDRGSARPWQIAWMCYFEGISLLAETEPAQHDAGMVSLAYLPARFGESQPYLSGLAVSRLADACEAAGDAPAAHSLRNELLARYPHHPVIAAGKRAGPSLNASPIANEKESS